MTTTSTVPTWARSHPGSRKTGIATARGHTKLNDLGVDAAVFISAEPTLARKSPRMIPLDLGAAGDKSLANAPTASDDLVAA